MGASVSGYWPGITDEQCDSLTGFDNDCKAWGNWMAKRYNHPDVLDAMKRLGVGSLLSHITEGMEEDEVDWVSPDDFMKAAEQLRELVLARDPRVKRIVETYALSANGVDPVHEEFAQDLADVRLIARFAKEMGVPKMTLEVNW
ncbi:MAG: hypothetical protein L0Y72_05200 [Gemmataceae bacterium]|nr:hypothetical protein [Gemmataceae bacterium]MCI0738419.1 hypothetical protein [Gemmataceae bacterium]